MTENVEEHVSAEEQEQEALVNVSQTENKPLSQQGSQDAVLRKEIELLKSELRGLQGKQDKSASQFEKLMQQLNVELTPEQKTELRIMQLEERLGNKTETSSGLPASEPEKPNVTPVEEIDFEDCLRAMQMEPSNETIAASAKAKTEAEYLKMLKDIKAKQANKPQPTGISAVLPESKTKSSTGDVAEIQRQIDALTKDGEFMTPSGIEKLKELGKQLEVAEGK